MGVDSVGMKELLEAGVHFGHKSEEWNPGMKKYIFMKKKGVHIIDLQKTLFCVEQAYNYVKNVVANGGDILFVGTKKQARQSVREAASSCGQHYIAQRWVGGLLSNFEQVSRSIEKIAKYEGVLEDPEKRKNYTKKQLILMEKKLNKIKGTFEGVRNMKKMPSALFVVDVSEEKVAITEARLMGIPTISLVDTNSDPDLVDVVIPGNDDAIRAISLFVGYISEAVKEGSQFRGGGVSEGDFSKSQEGGVSASGEKVAEPSEGKRRTQGRENSVLERESGARPKEQATPKAVDSAQEKNGEISAAEVKKLRDMTNISMMECKKALVEAKGDMDKALRILRERGMAVAAKRSDKETNEGVACICETDEIASMFVLGCETDFVAKSSDFVSMTKAIEKQVSSEGIDTLDGEEVKTLIHDTVAKCGERIVIANKVAFSKEKSVVGTYIHSNQKIGSLVELETESRDERVKQLAKDLAMQVAAMRPIALRQSDVDEATRSEQREIVLKQMESEDKPEEMKAKIVEGKVNKYFSDLCLEDMVFVKDGKSKVKNLVDELKKEVGASSLSIKRFERFQVGR